MMQEKDNTVWIKRIDGVAGLIHVTALILSGLLIFSISRATLESNTPFYLQTDYLDRQWWICLGLIACFGAEWFVSKHKWSFLKKTFPFLLISIPYLNLVPIFGSNFSASTLYALSFLPLIRAGYAIAVLVGWFAYDHATRLFVTYLCTVLAVVYFSSLVFYDAELGINPLVKNYDDALWWAAMQATTVGCNIEAVTVTGKILSVLVALCGLLLLPVFTVYVTNAITNARNVASAYMQSQEPTGKKKGEKESPQQ